MASMSLGAAPAIISVPSSGPRHGRKHSRHPTAAAPLPAFSFNPASPMQMASQQGHELATDVDGTVVRDAENIGHVRRPSKPAPLPEFVFNPGATLPSEPTPSPTHPILEEMALNQQRVSKSAKPAPLPAFTFNPGASNGSASPTRLDSELEPMRNTGHKRAGSEFVGGKAENAQLVLNSPVKHEPKPSNPSAAKRGHNHRRSQAISISDIDTSDLIKQHAIAKTRGTSNPSTPQDSNFSFSRANPGHQVMQSADYASPGSPRRLFNPGSRPRTVDFSERVDVIPRPLSMISSETERSNSTVRGHSVSNSINSIASPSFTGMPESDPKSAFASPEPVVSTRPKTADASLIIGFASDPRPEDLLSVPKRPLSASGSPVTLSSSSPPTKKKHFWSAAGNDPSPTPTPRIEKSNPMDLALAPTPGAKSSKDRPKTAPERSSAMRRRKYHTWTAGIFGKKSKARSGKTARRSPTPPMLLRRDTDRLNDVFDADDTVVLRVDSPEASRKQMPPALHHLTLPRFPASQDTTSPMLDLDLALSASEAVRHSEDHSRSTTARIAKLHSSERRGVVDAFGVNHRRTESAPALSPVNRSSLFGARQHGSNASLTEDVFDEEEEDNFLAHQQETKFPAAPSAKTTAVNSLARRESGLGLSNMHITSDEGVVIINPDTDATDDLQSSRSTLDAPMQMNHEILKRPATSPMAFAYPDPQSHYASSTEGRTTTASLISSPDPDHIYFEAQSRPQRFGELGADLIQPSNEDLSSLSDSITSNTHVRTAHRTTSRPSFEHRSNSMFVPGTSRGADNWKRSSLASLNRLIPGSSHGSKLKLETFASLDAQTKAKKKTHRISKLMKFWRPKETDERPTTSA